MGTEIVLPAHLYARSSLDASTHSSCFVA